MMNNMYKMVMQSLRELMVVSHFSWHELLVKPSSRIKPFPTPALRVLPRAPLDRLPYNLAIRWSVEKHCVLRNKCTSSWSEKGIDIKCTAWLDSNPYPLKLKLNPSSTLLVTVFITPHSEKIRKFWTKDFLCTGENYGAKSATLLYDVTKLFRIQWIFPLLPWLLTRIRPK